MKKYENVFITELEEYAKKLELSECSLGEIEASGDATKLIINALTGDYSNHISILNYVTNRLNASKISSEEKFKILKKIIIANDYYFNNTSVEKYIETSHFSFDLICGCLKEMRIYSEDVILYQAALICSNPIKELMTGEYRIIYENLSKKIDFEAVFSKQKYINSALKYIFETGIDVDDVDKLLQIAKFTNLNIDLFKDLSEILVKIYKKRLKDIFISKIQEREIKEENQRIPKMEVKKYDPNEYKNLRNQISEKYDTRLGRIFEELNEEQIIELGIMIYKAYGEDELKKYFANVFESVISPISEYTKTMMMYEKIMYYQEKFQEKEIEDLKSYIEYIEEFGYEECSKEFERTVNKMKKMIPSSYSFEIEKVKNILANN